MGHLLSENAEDVLLELATKKIKQEMENLKKSDKSLASRRWIWELIQNANDCGNSKIKIIIKDNYFEFSHDGKEFDSKTLWPLITQLSRKGILAEDKSIGKFGTGFITTHLLSEKINISGVFLDEKKGRIPLNFELDRSGESFEDFFNNLKKNLENVDRVLDQENCEGINIVESTDTVFRYNVTSDKNKFLEDGKNELKKNYGLLLGFNKKLKSIKLNNTIYFKNEEIQVDEYISNIKIYEKTDFDENVTELLIARYEDVEIAIFIKDKEVKEIKNDISRIFCKFPLIGSEKFNFPVVINSENFEVPVERNTILPDSCKNKELMKKAIELYIKLIKYLELNEYTKIYNACERIEKTEFVLEDDIRKINDMIRNAKIIEIFSEKKELKSQMNGENKLETIVSDFIDDEYWSLITRLKKLKPIPSKDSWKKWSKIYENIIPIKKILNYVVFGSDLKKRKEVFGDTKKFVDFLNDLYKLEFKENSREIYSSEEKIILNQNNQFISYNDAYIDEDIREDLKDLGLKFGIDIKEHLINKDILIENLENLNLRKKNNKAIATKIVLKVRELLKQEPREKETQELFNELVLWFLNNESLAKEIFEEIFEDKYKLATKEEIIESFNRGEKIKKILEQEKISFDELEKRVIDEFSENNDLDIFKYEKYSTKDKFNLIMKRTEKNIIKYLKNLGNYDFSEAEKADTEAIIYNNVKKNDDERITIMMRPSDGNKIIIYVEDELDILKDAKYELWVDNDVDKPRRITLGDILDKTGIRVIPLKHIVK